MNRRLRLFRVKGFCRSNIRDDDRLLVGCEVWAKDLADALLAVLEDSTYKRLVRDHNLANLEVKEVHIGATSHVRKWDEVVYSLK